MTRFGKLIIVILIHNRRVIYYLWSDSHEYSLPEKHQNNRDSGIKSLEARMHTIKIYAPNKIVNQYKSLLPWRWLPDRL